ncbi:MAG: hypothetical protein ACOYNS_05175 [Bacteroidota bacterium]
METNLNNRSFFVSDGHLNENGISLYADALLLDKQKQLPPQITEHVELCDDCKEQVFGLYEVMQEQPVDTSLPHPYFDAPHKILSFSIYYRAAAIFVLAVAGGTAYFLYSSRQSSEVPPPVHVSIPIVPTDSTPAEKGNDEHAIVENSIPSSNLEDLVTSNFRSSSIEVLTPVAEAIVSSPITFRWKEYPHAVILRILNNKDVTLLTANVKTNTFVTSRSFLPGLYYWKLEDDGELLFVGKFFVK